MEGVGLVRCGWDILEACPFLSSLNLKIFSLQA